MKKKSDESMASRLETGVVEQVEGAPERRETVSVSFKKAFSGFDVGQVMEYIEQQEQNYRNSCTMYDSKIDEFKSEIALLNRECDSDRREIEKLKDKLKKSDQRYDEIMAMSPDAFAAAKAAAGGKEAPDFVKAQIDSATAELQKKLTAANAELADTKQQLEQLQNADVSAQNYEKQLAAADEQLQTMTEQLSRQSDELLERQADIKALEDKLRSLAPMSEEVQRLSAETEKLAAQTEGYKKAAREAQGELVDRGEQYELLFASNEALKKRYAELETQLSEYQQQIADYQSSISALTDDNMKQKREFAVEKNEIESQSNEEKYRLVQAAQLHGYQFKQLELVFDELQRQFDKAKETLDNFCE